MSRMGASREEIAAEAMNTNSTYQLAKRQFRELESLADVNTILSRALQAFLTAFTGFQADALIPAETMGDIQVPHFRQRERNLYVPVEWKELPGPDHH